MVKLDDLLTEQDDVKKKNVRKFMTLIYNGHTVKDVKLERCHRSGNFLLPDGNHRVQAYRKLGYDSYEFEYELCPGENCSWDICRKYFISVRDVKFKK